MDELDRRLLFERLFSAHASAVRAYARRRADAASADDAVSEVFVIAWRRLDDVPEDALPWLLGCARRVLAHQQRRLGRDRALLTRVKPVGPVDIAGVDGVLAQAFSQLSARDREVLLLVSWEGVDTSQAAEVLGCSRNALAVRVHRARKRLATALMVADSVDDRGIGISRSATGGLVDG